MNHKNIIKKILLIGPLPPPVTGEALCNEAVVRRLGDDPDVSIDFINTSTGFFDENLGKIRLAKIWINLKKYVYLYKIPRSDIVYITLGQTFFGLLKFFPYLLTAKLAGKHTVIHIHGNRLHRVYEALTGIRKTIFRRIVSMADEGIVLTENLKHNLDYFLPDEKIHTLNNFVDDKLLPENKEVIREKNFDRLRILYLSNLMREKGIFELLEALEILDREGVEYSAVLAGNIDAAIKSSVMEKINRLPKVSYAGTVTGKQKKEIFLRSNVFILPTYYRGEGQPLSVLEAMGTGNLVITTRHPGITDVLDENQVIYIDKKSVPDIVRTLKKLSVTLPQYKTRILKNYDYIVSNFTEDQFISGLKKILRV